MKTSIRPDHRALCEALRRRVLEGPGETPPALRQASAERAAGGPAADQDESEPLATDELLVEEVSIDGMCGVY